LLPLSSPELPLSPALVLRLLSMSGAFSSPAAFSQRSPFLAEVRPSFYFFWPQFLFCHAPEAVFSCFFRGISCRFFLAKRPVRLSRLDHPRGVSAVFPQLGSAFSSLFSRFLKVQICPGSPPGFDFFVLPFAFISS